MTLSNQFELREIMIADAQPTAVLRAGSGAGLDVVALGPAQTDLAGIAYVLYTSGTTGRPKGVLISQERLGV